MRCPVKQLYCSVSWENNKIPPDGSTYDYKDVQRDHICLTIKGAVQWRESTRLLFFFICKQLWREIHHLPQLIIWSIYHLEYFQWAFALISSSLYTSLTPSLLVNCKAFDHSDWRGRGQAVLPAHWQSSGVLSTQLDWHIKLENTQRQRSSLGV